MKCERGFTFFWQEKYHPICDLYIDLFHHFFFLLLGVGNGSGNFQNIKSKHTLKFKIPFLSPQFQNKAHFHSMMASSLLTFNSSWSMKYMSILILPQCINKSLI